MKIIARTFLFAAILPLLYILMILVFSRIEVGGSTVIKIATRNPVTPGDFGFTLQRFRDVENYQNVDILFLGSSHCYRTFDTRIYEEHGLKTFNMGTTGQTPLNTYYLLKHYFPRLNPRLVVFDLNYRVIDRDGLESFYDLYANMNYFPEMLEMAFAIKSFHAINGAVSKWLLYLTGDAPQYRQRERQEDFYVPGGYVEFRVDSTAILAAAAPGPGSQTPKKHSPRVVTPSGEQLDYIAKVIQLVKKNSAGIVLITKPEPEENLKVIANYDKVSQAFAELAARNKVEYIDFNKLALPLNAREYFYDKEYFSPAGVQIFNPILIEYLYQRQ